MPRHGALYALGASCRDGGGPGGEAWSITRNVDTATLRKTLENQGVNLLKEAIDLTEVRKNSNSEVPGSVT